MLTEARLGRPMDEALQEMAARVGSKNFDFVITAVTIQRQVGGSLAGLIDMVADTVRQRQQFARKIKGLTAMGRASAYVLMGLPFFIATHHHDHEPAATWTRSTTRPPATSSSPRVSRLCASAPSSSGKSSLSRGNRCCCSSLHSAVSRAAAYFLGELATLPARQRATSVRRAATYGRFRVRTGLERESLRNRALVPLSQSLAGMVLKLNPRTTSESVGLKLQAAGLGKKISPTSFLAVKGIFALAAAGLALVLIGSAGSMGCCSGSSSCSSASSAPTTS